MKERKKEKRRERSGDWGDEGRVSPVAAPSSSSSSSEIAQSPPVLSDSGVYCLYSEDASKQRHPPTNTLRATSPLPLHREICVFFHSFPTRINKTSDEEEEEQPYELVKLQLITGRLEDVEPTPATSPSVAPYQPGCFTVWGGSSCRILLVNTKFKFTRTVNSYLIK